MITEEEMPIWIARSGRITMRAYHIVLVVRSLKAGPLGRKAYISKIEAVLTGPFQNWILLSLAKLNFGVAYRKRYLEELIATVEYEYPIWILHPIKGQFRRRTAAIKAIERLRKDEAANHEFAARWLSEKRKLTRPQPLPKKNIEEFFLWATKVLDQTLSAESSAKKFLNGQSRPKRTAKQRKRRI